MEILYRRCNRTEAEAMSIEQGLVEGNIPISIFGVPNRSDKDKWVSKSKKYVQVYKPNGFKPEDYKYCAVMRVDDGTLDALATYRQEGEIAKGPRGGYGIPPEFLRWINNRIISVEVFDMEQSSLPNTKYEPKIKILRNDDKSDTYATFIAVPERLVQPLEDKLISFTDELNLDRMTWGKTSLLWTLWRSDWGRKERQERILKINLDREYLGFIFNEAINKKNSIPENTIISQDDPDRIIISKRWNDKQDNYFVKGGKTRHFGFRNKALRYYLGLEKYQRQIEDITPKVTGILEKRPALPTEALYEELNLVPEELD